MTNLSCKFSSPYDVFQDDVTLLDEYVQRPDNDIFHWEKIDQYNMTFLGCTAHVLNVTSHRWMDGMYACHNRYILIWQRFRPAE